MTSNGNEKTNYDVIIVGGGPAGLCAAMYSGRGMIDALLIERGLPGGELLNTELIEDYPGFESILGRDLAEKMADHAKKFGAIIVTDTVDSIEKDDDGAFDVRTQLGKTYHAPTVSLTAGGSPNTRGGLALRLRCCAFTCDGHSGVLRLRRRSAFRSASASAGLNRYACVSARRNGRIVACALSPKNTLRGRPR